MSLRIGFLTVTVMVCALRAESRTVEAANLSALSVEAPLVFRGKIVELEDGLARFEPDRVYKGTGMKLVEIRFPTLAGCVPTTPMSLLSHSHWLVMAKPQAERWVAADRCAGIAAVSPLMSPKASTIETDLFAGISDSSVAGRIESWKRIAGFRAGTDRRTLMDRLESTVGEERRWALYALELATPLDPEVLAEFRDTLPRTSRAQLLTNAVEFARRALDTQIQGREMVRDLRRQPQLNLSPPSLDHESWVKMFRHFFDEALAAERLPAIVAQLRHSQAQIRWEALASMARMEPDCKLPPPERREAAALDVQAAACAEHWAKRNEVPR